MNDKENQISMTEIVSIVEQLTRCGQVQLVPQNNYGYRISKICRLVHLDPIISWKWGWAQLCFHWPAMYFVFCICLLTNQLSWGTWLGATVLALTELITNVFLQRKAAERPFICYIVIIIIIRIILFIFKLLFCHLGCEISYVKYDMITTEIQITMTMII